jgi:Tol biopolymer transport system component
MVDPVSRGIYFVTSKETGSLYSLDMHSGASNEIIPELASQPALSPDGKSLMYLRVIQREKNEEIWTSSIEGNNRVRIAAGSRANTGSWSPDGTKIAFTVDQKAYVANANGRNLHQIPIKDAALMNNIVWSNDGEALYITVNIDDFGSNGLVWKAAANGQKAEAVTAGFMINDISADGKFLIGIGNRSDNLGINQISVDDKKSTVVVEELNSLNAYFAKDGKSILYTTATPEEITIYSLPWENGKVTGPPVVAQKIAPKFPLVYYGNAFDFTKDLSTLVYARPSVNADIYLLSYK